MKKLFFVGIIAIGGLLFAACDQTEDPTPRDAKTYTVALQLGGEILSVEYSDLSKGANDLDLYGIQVDTRVAGTMGEYAHYAYGLFDNLDNVTITLLDGNEYRFQVRLVKDGKERIEHPYMSDGYYYAHPFFTNGSSNTGYTPIGQVFNYSASTYFPFPNSPYVLHQLNALISYPDVDSYYGELSGFVPGNSQTATINVKRVAFGLHVIADGLTEGKLIIQMEGAPALEIAYPETEMDKIVSMSDVSAAWTTDNYKVSLSTSFSWVKDNEEEVPLATQSLDFYRNKKTTITVQVQNNNPGASLAVIPENTPMGDGGSYNI